MIKYGFLLIFALFLLNGCSGSWGQKGYIDSENRMIGKKLVSIKPFTFKNAGEFTRAKFQIAGQGITHVTKNENGDLVVHWFSSEILPHYPNKKWVGKCLTYEIVDSKTHILKDWGFDKGGNPLSCRHWP